MKWLNNTFPKLGKFNTEFVNALKNDKSGFSLRKLLAIGFFWLTCVLAIRYTNKDNLIAVLTILTAQITALIITYTAGNNREQRISKDGEPTTTTDPPKE